MVKHWQLCRIRVLISSLSTCLSNVLSVTAHCIHAKQHPFRNIKVIRKLIQFKLILSKLRSLLLIVKRESWLPHPAGVSSLATVSLTIAWLFLILFENAYIICIKSSLKLLREEVFLNLNQTVSNLNSQIYKVLRHLSSA